MEWLANKNIVVQTTLYGETSICFLLENDDHLTFIRKFKADTEYNAVFKACTWIINNCEVGDVV